MRTSPRFFFGLSFGLFLEKPTNQIFPIAFFTPFSLVLPTSLPSSSFLSAVCVAPPCCAAPYSRRRRKKRIYFSSLRHRHKKNMYRVPIGSLVRRANGPPPPPPLTNQGRIVEAVVAVCSTLFLLLVVMRVYRRIVSKMWGLDDCTFEIARLFLDIVHMLFWPHRPLKSEPSPFPHHFLTLHVSHPYTAFPRASVSL
jgi:hypothetical protein